MILRFQWCMQSDWHMVKYSINGHYCGLRSDIVFSQDKAETRGQFCIKGVWVQKLFGLWKGHTSQISKGGSLLQMDDGDTSQGAKGGSILRALGEMAVGYRSSWWEKGWPRGDWKRSAKLGSDVGQGWAQHEVHAADLACAWRFLVSSCGGSCIHSGKNCSWWWWKTVWGRGASESGRLMDSRARTVDSEVRLCGLE